MKLSEKQKKILTRIWGLYTLAFIVVRGLALFGILPLPKVAERLLWSLFWLGMGFIDTNRKQARWWYGLAAAHLLPALFIFLT